VKEPTKASSFQLLPSVCPRQVPRAHARLEDPPNYRRPGHVRVDAAQGNCRVFTGLAPGQSRRVMALVVPKRILNGFARQRWFREEDSSTAFQVGHRVHRIEPSRLPSCGREYPRCARRPRADESSSGHTTHRHRGVITADREVDRDLTRGAWPSAERGGRIAECRHDALTVREVSTVGADGPAAAAGSVFDARAKKGIGELALNVVIERHVVHGRLRGRLGRHRQSSRAADAAGPLEPQTPGPLRRVVQPVARDVSGGAANGDRSVLIVGGIQPGHMAPDLDAAPDPGRVLHFHPANRRGRRVPDVVWDSSCADQLAERERAFDGGFVRREMTAVQTDGAIVYSSETMGRVLAQTRLVAPTNTTVLLLGETGVGKEMFAEAIHSASHRRRHPMIRVSCAAIPTSLIERELFGHERGAFTGAWACQIGRFEAAHGSTIFLDEIGELPLEMQVKLLRVLQERCFERLGGNGSIKVDVRIIAATNRDLDEAVRNHAFREDLFYRLNVFPITIPPLRERAGDIPGLVWRFVDELSPALGKQIEGISGQSFPEFQRYRWPGNVRELRNVIERELILAQGPTLTPTVPLARPLARGAACSGLTVPCSGFFRAGYGGDHHRVPVWKPRCVDCVVSSRPCGAHLNPVVTPGFLLMDEPACSTIEGG
jgi:Sigma-54 interaction domain